MKWIVDCFRCHGRQDEKNLPEVSEPPMRNLNEICEGRWFEPALVSQRAVFAHAENNGVTISEGRLACFDEYLNYVSATATVGSSARGKRMALRVNEVDVCVPDCHRPLGRVLILLAPFGGGIGLFSHVLPALVENFEAIYCIDPPGMGLSSRWTPYHGGITDGDAIMNEYGNMFTMAFDDLGNRDPRFKYARTRVLAVHSLSTQFAMRWIVDGGMSSSMTFHMLTLISPLGVGEMNLNLPPLDTLTRKERFALRIARMCQRGSITPQMFLRHMPRQSARRIFEQSIFPLLTVRRMPPEMVNYLCLLTRAPCSVDRLIYRVMIPNMFDFRNCLEQLVDRVKIPVAFLWGDDDLVDYRTAGQEILQEMDGACSVHVIDESRHVPFFENVPDFANGFINAFRIAMKWKSEQKQMRNI